MTLPDYSRLYVLIVAIARKGKKKVIKEAVSNIEAALPNIADNTILDVKRITHSFQEAYLRQYFSQKNSLITELYELTIAAGITDIEAVREEAVAAIAEHVPPVSIHLKHFYMTAAFYGELASPNYHIAADSLIESIEPLDHEEFDPFYTLIDIAKSEEDTTQLRAKLLLLRETEDFST